MTKALNTVSTEALPKVVPAVTSLVTGVSNAAASFEQVARGDSTMKEAALSVKKQLVDGFDGILKGIKQKVDEWMPAKSGKEPSRDTGTLGMTGRLFEANDFYGKVAKGETVLTPKQLENLVSGVSGTTLGDSVPPPTKSIEEGFSTVISSMQTAQQKMQLSNQDSLSTVASSVTATVNDAMISPTKSMKDGLSTMLSSIGNIADDAKLVPTKSMQDGFSSIVSAMQAAQQKTQSESKKPDTNESLPAVISDALTAVFEGPNGFASVMNSVKAQLSDDNTKQLGAMQEQISKLNDLVSAMQDNVRASENIANVLG
jgi:hypothetical protein